ncbi:DUF1542 domain-containing protein [Staphylococcus haemolyticus]|uniref:DUF1542 domain-containing protein n=1 Tax=Staphylococcus haemolyticus TaxID=1283 RepID=UPI001F3BE320|nr:DUF1542 domain-containing protein [Staphylococcus haemolyticus]
MKIVKKPEAQKIILEVANKQKDKIDQLVGLTDEQRNKAKYLIDEIVRKALDKLNKDITNKDVDSILNKAVEDIKKVNPTVSKGEQVLPRDSNDGIDRNNNNKLGNNSNTNPSSNNKSNKLPSTGEESQRQSPLAGFALISGLFLFLKNRKRNKENN